MFCPQCKAEYRSGFTRCSDCDVPLVTSLPAEPKTVAQDTEEVVVFVAADMVEAEAVKGLLDVGNIEAFLVGESSPLPGIPGAVEVVVRQDQAELASALIDEYRKDAETVRGYIVPFPGQEDSDSSE